MTNQDPISEIKQAEEEAAKKAAAAKADFDDKLRQAEEDFGKKLKEFEEELRKKGTEKLETVKKEAGELFKSKMATYQSQVGKLTSEAKTKQEDAVKTVINAFLDHIKK